MSLYLQVGVGEKRWKAVVEKAKGFSSVTALGRTMNRKESL
jgi:hypothetical protein